MFPWTHPLVQRTIVHRNHLEISLEKQRSSNELILPYDFTFLCDLSTAYFNEINPKYQVRLKGRRILIPKDTRKILLKTKDWVKQLFTRKTRIILSVYGNSYAGPAVILHNLLNRVPISTFKRIFYTFFRKRYQPATHGDLVLFEPLFLAAIMSNRLQDITYIGAGKNVICKPKFPPRIYSWESAVLLGLWSSDARLTNMYGLGTKDIGIKYFAEDLFKECLGEVKLHNDRSIEYRSFSNVVRNFHIVASAIPGIKTITDPKVPEWIKNRSSYVSGWFLGLFLGDGTVYLTKNTEYLRVEYSRSIDLKKKLLELNLPVDKILRIVHDIHEIAEKRGTFIEASGSYGLGINALRKFGKHVRWINKTVPNFVRDEISLLQRFLEIKPVLSVHRIYALKTGRVSIMWRVSLNGFNALKFLRWIKIDRIKKYNIKKVTRALAAMRKFLSKRSTK